MWNRARLPPPPAGVRPGRRRFTAAIGSASALLLTGGCAAPRRPPPATLRVKVFPGFQNLPLYAAVDRGYFEREGLAVELLATRNSVELRDELAAGAVDIAHAAVDNAVAMRDVANRDVVVVMGGDDGLNELFVQPDIASVEQMRARTLIVDAPDTAYALQARKILADHGLRAGDYRVKVVGATFQRVQAMILDRGNAASTLNPPYSFQARDAGLKSLGRVTDLIGPYQASAGFTMRAWAAAHGDLLVRYISAYVAALRWSLDPANREPAIRLLADGLQVSAAIAGRTYAALADPKRGLTRDAELDAAGFATTLALRAELEGGAPAAERPQNRYLDLSWYRSALRRLPVA